MEVPPPRSLEQRVSILKVHTQSMHQAGRMLVSDPPPGSAADRILNVSLFEMPVSQIIGRPLTVCFS